MKIILISFIFFVFPFSLQVFSQVDSKTSKDTTYILGKVNWEYWQNHTNWSDYQAENYTPDSAKIEYLKYKIKTDKVSFILFCATWCSDSKEQMPKIIKLLKLINYDIKNLEIYGVDRSKKEPTHSSEMMMIERVPTLIVLINGIESGRIIEFPQPNKTWEDEIIDLLSLKITK
jgi:thiol-disulfide isomerase/thioredoxin